MLDAVPCWDIPEEETEADVLLVGPTAVAELYVGGRYELMLEVVKSDETVPSPDGPVTLV